jgi:predicted dehydrogenase
VKHTYSRRAFLELATALGTLCVPGCSATPAKASFVRGKLRHAGIGVGGMGESDLKEISAHPEVEIVALCDVDLNNLNAAAKLHPGARTYRDWREMLSKESDAIDSVHVTVPDHMHAAIELVALGLGKHVYGQKPLTRTIEECRAVARAARASGAVTQMGIQNRSNTPYRQALALFHAGHIGKVHEVHIWTDRPAGWWPQGMGRPAGSDPVPATLKWDEWLGVAPERPYKDKVYHPFVWRGWQAFGTGAQGDMACHLIDPATWFLELGDPTRIRSDGPRPNDESYPLWSTVHYEFPATAHTTRGPLLLTWYDGGRLPPRSLLDDLEAGEVVKNACLFVGEEGALLASPYDPPRLLPGKRFASIALPAAPPENHWHQWVDACRGQGTTTAPFSYAAHLTEIALLGNVALHFPHETLEWNARAMSFADRPDADVYLRSPQRKGWEIQGLG